MNYLTPSLPQPVKFPGCKIDACVCAFKQCIFSSHVTQSTLNAKRFDKKKKNLFTCQCEAEDKKAVGFQISPFHWSFSRDLVAVKGLKKRLARDV